MEVLTPTLKTKKSTIFDRIKVIEYELRYSVEAFKPHMNQYGHTKPMLSSIRTYIESHGYVNESHGEQLIVDIPVVINCDDVHHIDDSEFASMIFIARSARAQSRGVAFDFTNMDIVHDEQVQQDTIELVQRLIKNAFGSVLTCSCTDIKYILEKAVSGAKFKVVQSYVVDQFNYGINTLSLANDPTQSLAELKNIVGAYKFKKNPKYITLGVGEGVLPLALFTRNMWWQMLNYLNKNSIQAVNIELNETKINDSFRHLVRNMFNVHGILLKFSDESVDVGQTRFNQFVDVYVNNDDKFGCAYDKFSDAWRKIMRKMAYPEITLQ